MQKLEIQQPKKAEILQWEDIKEEFIGGDLFLGNGFAIKICNKLNYKSLFENFLSNISIEEREIFKGFETNNFEAILNKINTAIKVNKLFDLPADLLSKYMEVLKEGLIETIHKNHPKFKEVNDEVFQKLSLDLENFEDIFTTNYDTFLYRISMITKNRHEARQVEKRLKDYFLPDEEKKILTFNNRAEDKLFRNLYYLHGALFLFNENNEVVKIQRKSGQNKEILDLISAKIRNKEFPLFVSEGDYQEKERKIKNDEYLSFCFDRFKGRSKNLVIYGFSFSSDQDYHIIRELNTDRRNIAISVYTENHDEETLKNSLDEIRFHLTRNKNKKVLFFDANSLF